MSDDTTTEAARPWAPNTTMVRLFYIAGAESAEKVDGGLDGWTREEARAEFERWLADHDREVQARALRDHRRRVVRFYPNAGLIAKATVLADLDDYAARLTATTEGATP